MGANLSTPEKIARCARSGDADSLSMLLADLQRNDAAFRTNRSRYLEQRDDHGNTPLTLAAARGHIAVVKLLLQYSANIHHVNNKADGGSALHEAVAHKHEAVVELLLSQGGNPFVENVKGFTAMDIACSTRNVPLLRRLEQCAPYVGWLLIKVPQFGGLGSSWQRRWVVVSHRYPNPQAPANRQLTHCVFLAYKTLANTAPSCRVWLDGARAREVYNPKAEARLQFSAAGAGPRVAQAGITLHRKHELPSGVYTTGGHGAGGSSMVGGTPQEGYTFYLRPDDGSQISINALDRLIRTVNNRGFPPSTEPAPSTAPARPGPLGASVAGLAAGAAAGAGAGALPPHPATLSVPNMATTPGTWGADDGAAAYMTVPAGSGRPQLESTESDELIARRLQEEYDAEVAHQMQEGGAAPGQPRPQRPQQAQQHAHAPQSAPPSFTAAGAAVVGAAAPRPDYLTGPGFYPAVHFNQPGSAPAAAAAAAGRPDWQLQGASSAPPQMSADMQAAAAAGAAGGAGTSTPSTPGGVPLAQLESFGRPTAPSLLDFDYPPAAPLAGGLAAAASSSGGAGPSAPPQQGQLGTTLSGRHMSAPGLEDDSWWQNTPAAPPSRPSSEPGDREQAQAAKAQAAADATDDSAVCVVCMDAESTSGVLHGDSVHKCLCKDCALMLKESKVQDCPLCREHIEAFIMRVF